MENQTAIYWREEQKNLIQTMLVDKLTDDELFDLNGQMVRRYSHYADLKREHDNGAQ